MFKKIDKFIGVLSYFITREWEFSNENVKNLWHEISEKDKELFPFDITKIDWDSYQKSHVLGLRKHILKEDLSNVPEARKRYYRYYMSIQCFL